MSDTVSETKEQFTCFSNTLRVCYELEILCESIIGSYRPNGAPDWPKLSEAMIPSPTKFGNDWEATMVERV